MGASPTWRGWFGAKWWPAGRVEWPPPTRASSCRSVATKARDEPPQTLADQPLGPLSLGSGPLGPRVKYTPMVMMILTFGQLHFVIP
jgi:hypothetical protein